MNELTDIHTYRYIDISLYLYLNQTKQIVSGLLAQKIMALIYAHLQDLKNNSYSGTNFEQSAVKTVKWRVLT